MPVGLAPNTVQAIKSESTGISANHTDLSTFGWAANGAGAGGQSPQQLAAYLGKKKEDGGPATFLQRSKEKQPVFPNAAITEAGPLDFPLHPGAEKYYREKGYL